MTLRPDRPPHRPLHRAPLRLSGLLSVALALLLVGWHSQQVDQPRPRILLHATAAPVAPSDDTDDDSDLAAGPIGPGPLLARQRIVAFQGHPLAPVLGVLGQHEPEAMVARLRAQADAYRAQSGDRAIAPALYLIYAVAQREPGRDGSYLIRMSDEVVEEYVELARREGLLVLLDIQVGRSTVEAELEHIARWLVHEHVHVGLDPEFAWGPHDTPGVTVGSLNAAQLNRAQHFLQRIAIERQLPSKVLVVHQFIPEMVRDRERIRAFDRVELVHNADGVGTRAAKLIQWRGLIADQGITLAGIKLFYEHDIDVLTPSDVLNLNPRPAIIVYQ